MTVTASRSNAFSQARSRASRQTGSCCSVRLGELKSSEACEDEFQKTSLRAAWRVRILASSEASCSRRVSSASNSAFRPASEVSPSRSRQKWASRSALRLSMLSAMRVWSSERWASISACRKRSCARRNSSFVRAPRPAPPQAPRSGSVCARLRLPLLPPQAPVSCTAAWKEASVARWRTRTRPPAPLPAAPGAGAPAATPARRPSSGLMPTALAGRAQLLRRFSCTLAAPVTTCAANGRRGVEPARRINGVPGPCWR
mmetsp:Transcript_14731/g.47098  ORF Transcript_14731/g.47098 Transcript_14731/m.47098 type:complete len:258 (+) Transcript_14731:249-1022(+)